MTINKKSDKQIKMSFLQVIYQMPCPVVVTDDKGFVFIANKKFLNVFGYSEESIINPINVLKNKDFIKSGIVEQFKKASLGQKVFLPELSITFDKTDSKQEIIFEIIIYPVFDYDGKVNQVVATFKDITESKRNHEILKKYQLLSESARDIILFVDSENGKIIDVNDKAVEEYGYKKEELLKLSIQDIRPTETKSSIGNELKKAASEGILFETVHRRKDGSIFPVEVSSKGTDIDGRKILLSIVRNITKRKKAEEIIKHQAFYDLLTDLPNRTLFYDRLFNQLKLANNYKEYLATLFLDLDYFKEVNDNFGHVTGDRLLQYVAKRLKGLLRESETCARLGGDEFLILLPKLKRIKDAESVAGRIIRSFKQPWMINGKKLKISTSIGIALHPGDGESAEQLIHNADTAMYFAKQKGRCCYKFYKDIESPEKIYYKDRKVKI